jgi:DNA-damage-inducible protein J
MKTDLISTRIEHDLKVEFTTICEDLGLSTSQALKIFAKAVINYGGIPFELKSNRLNSASIKAIEELENGKGIKAKNSEALFSDLGIDL